MTAVINFIAGPGAGKSLMSAQLYVELKKLHYTVEYVQEYAKTLVWQDKFEELNNQYSVTNNQYAMLKPLVGKVDYIISDSSLFLGLFFNEYNGDNISNVDKTRAMILDKMKEFDNKYIFLERDLNLPFEKAGRIQDLQESIKIDNLLLDLFKQYSIEYIKILSNTDNIQQIIDELKLKK